MVSGLVWEKSLIRSMYKAEFDFEILFVAFCGMTYDVS